MTALELIGPGVTHGRSLRRLSLSWAIRITRVDLLAVSRRLVTAPITTAVAVVHTETRLGGACGLFLLKSSRHADGQWGAMPDLPSAVCQRLLVSAVDGCCHSRWLLGLPIAAAAGRRLQGRFMMTSGQLLLSWSEPDWLSCGYCFVSPGSGPFWHADGTEDVSK